MGSRSRPALIVAWTTRRCLARHTLACKRSQSPCAAEDKRSAHSTADGGIVLDLRDMRALEFDAKARTAWAETGLTAAEYTTAADAYDLATGFGDTGSVGIGGITLGGGIGFLVRKYGLTIDGLLAADVVTADGKRLRVDAQSHPDLFWAIRGGGGNFGVATRFQYRLNPAGAMVGGVMMLPATADVIASYRARGARAESSRRSQRLPAPPMPMVPKSITASCDLRDDVLCRCRRAGERRDPRSRRLRSH